MNAISSDTRIDPRIRNYLGAIPEKKNPGDVASRAELLQEASKGLDPKIKALYDTYMNAADTEEIVPSSGLRVETIDIVSEPDGNAIKLQYISHEDQRARPCVYYIHGGGMATLSCFDGNFRAYGKMIARGGVNVCLVEFRNCLVPSTVPEVAPYPAGLNDCLSGLRYIHEHHLALHIDPTKVVVSGESGGGNLTLAVALSLKRSGELNLVSGLYASCPYILGQWPHPDCPSSYKSEEWGSPLANNRGAMGYGIEAFERQDPLAWPGFATVGDVEGFPPTVICVNEFDPLRDEGVNFYRLLLQAEVAAYCIELIGTTLAIQLFPLCIPELSRSSARDIASFACCW